MSVPLPAVTESLKGKTLSTHTHVDGFGEAFLFTPSLPPSIHPSLRILFLTCSDILHSNQFLIRSIYYILSNLPNQQTLQHDFMFTITQYLFLSYVSMNSLNGNLVTLHFHVEINRMQQY